MSAPVLNTTYIRKEYFSPSSISLGRRCLRRWGFRYLMGIREPELPYEYFIDPESEAEVKTLPEHQRMLWYSMRSKALGTSVHAVLESYYLGAESPDWQSPAGVIARAMSNLLPHPEQCGEIQTEQDITIDTSFFDYGALGVSKSDPINFSGKADLFVKVGGYWRLYDYKTTKSLKNDFEELGYNYVKTADELREDEQAGLYSLHALQRGKVDTIECEWVYGRTKGKADAASTKFIMGIARSQTLVKGLLVDAIGLRKLMRTTKRAMDLDGNPEACGDFGRQCEHHVLNGGECTVKQSLGTQLVQIKKKEESKQMGLPFKEALKKAKEETKSAKPKPDAAKSKAKKKDEEEEEETEEEEEEESEEEETEEEEEEEEKPSKKASKKAPAKSAKSAKPSSKASEVERAEVATSTISSGGVTITVSADISEADTVSAIADKITEEIFSS